MPKKQEKKGKGLSETARFVKQVMDEVIMPEMEKRGFAMEANEIIMEKPPKGSPKAVKFAIHLKEIEDICLKKISEDDPEKEKKQNVGKNFCSKLLRAVESAES